MSANSAYEKFVDVAPEAGDRSRGGLLVLLRNSMPIFGIEARGDLGRADQIAKENCQMAALFRRHRRSGLGGRRRRARRWRRARKPLTAAAAELLTGLGRGAARGACHGEDSAAVRAEAAVARLSWSQDGQRIV
jgi:hypothetical protein